MRPQRPLALALALALGLAFAGPARAESPKEALEIFFGRTNAILRSTDVRSGAVDPRQAVRALVSGIFDHREAATRALGAAWQSMTPARQGEFVRLFAEFLGRGYIAFVGSKANVSDGIQILYLEESIVGDSAAVATTLLGRNGSNLDVDYVMVRRGGRWMIRDVIIDGMSLISNYRAQFNRILSTSSHAELVARMQGETPETAMLAVAAAEPADLGPDGVEAAAAVVPAATIASVVQHEVYQETAHPVEVSAPRGETSRVTAAGPATRVQEAPTGASRVAASQYWIQVGAFRTVGAAVQMTERLRRQGIAASNEPPTSVPGHPAGTLARVRVGPFSSHSDAQAKVPDLIARGYAPFIPKARD